MSNSWSTEEQDITFAEYIIREHAQSSDNGALGLFEIVSNPHEKKFSFRLSKWVLILAKHFISQYGADQGDFVTRKIVTRCITTGYIIH